MILVVDDHADTARFLCRMLGRKGYPTQCAGDGYEAMEVLKAQSPQLVILDVQMPGMTGLEVLDALSRDARLRKVPVLVYSAADEPDQYDLALKLGAKAYMVKGATGVPELLELVAEHATPVDAA